MEGQPAAYIRQANGEWFFVRPDKPHNVLQEISHQDGEVVLQNQRTKLFIKPTPERAYWRQPEQEEWTTYYATAFGPAPEELLAKLAQGIDASPQRHALPGLARS